MDAQTGDKRDLYLMINTLLRKIADGVNVVLSLIMKINLQI